ncbi:MAG: hypothetical protein ACYDB3_09810, partial [Acidimicrobiales bacterium]
LLNAAGALAYLAVMAAWVVWFPALKRIWLLLLPVVFFFSPRSLSSYLVDLFPVAVIAAVTVHGTATTTLRNGGIRRPRRAALLVALPVLGVGITAALAFSSQPLQLSVHGVDTSHRGRRVDAVTVSVRNLTGVPQSPHFLVNTGAGIDGFWMPAGRRSVVLGPGASATVTLDAPVATTAPQYGARWLVEAYTCAPRTLSTSSLELWTGR